MSSPPASGGPVKPSQGTVQFRSAGGYDSSCAAQDRPEPPLPEPDYLARGAPHLLFLVMTAGLALVALYAIKALV